MILQYSLLHVMERFPHSFSSVSSLFSLPFEWQRHVFWLQSELCRWWPLVVSLCDLNCFWFSQDIHLHKAIKGVDLTYILWNPERHLLSLSWSGNQCWVNIDQRKRVPRIAWSVCICGEIPEDLWILVYKSMQSSKL